MRRRNLDPSILSGARILVLFGAAFLLAGLALLFKDGRALAQGAEPPTATEPAPGFHPDFPLLDADGANVLDSGAPISTMQTCGSCHDTEFIASHSFHADAGLSSFDIPGNVCEGRPWETSKGIFGGWDPLTYRYLSPVDDPLIDLTTADWLMRFGAGHIGGGPAVTARDGSPLASLSGLTVETGVTDPETGALSTWDWSESGTVEMNCFLCHTDAPDLAARAEAYTDGRFGWANTATLAAGGIVTESGDGYTYNPEAFTADGEIRPAAIGLGDPTNENCGACHGVAQSNPDVPITDADIAAWRTSTTGQVFSPQRISASGLNLSDKDDLNRAWDIHAERVVGCTDCHFSLNNPVYQNDAAQDDLEHLVFDPRRIDLGAYLQRPDHDFARGPNAGASIDPESIDTMRTCETCHDSAAAHDWLPYTERHMESVACESCHIPQQYAPAYESVDWTVLTADGSPVTTYRGLENEDGAQPLMTGFEPVLLARTDVTGATRLAPYNLVSAWYWVYGTDFDTRPVRTVDLEAAYFEGEYYAPDILAVFDTDGNGRLSENELVIDSDEKENLVAARLAALGLEDPRIQAEVRTFPINHGVTDGEWAVRECSSCHGEDSRVTAAIPLAGRAPGGVLPEMPAEFESGAVLVDETGALSYAPQAEGSEYYILGHDRVGWIDGFGLFSFIGVFAAITVHSGLRYFAARKYGGEGEVHTREVYMYSVYERLWHWLQTGAILILLLTGLIIHRPDSFGALSFRHVVLVHNVLAAVLVINAALSLFYHLVSGEIRQYLPRPRGFFDQAFEQAKFYIGGMFRGEVHPFEKTPERKLNPLQQITYFGILNVLLPLQIITGALMWGAQRWPAVAESLGGLPVLGPVHSLVAWMFAAFIVAHVYLTTTGPYPMAGIKAMMLGWDDVEVHVEQIDTDGAVEGTAAD